MECSSLAGKLPLGSFFLLTTPQKANFNILALTAEILRGAASFELRMTKLVKCSEVI